MTVRITHPRAVRGEADLPSVVPTGHGGSEVAADGTFDAPDAAFVRRVAEREGLAPVDLLAGECPFCDAYDGEHVGQHAAAAHPDAWDEFVEE